MRKFLRDIVHRMQFVLLCILIITITALLTSGCRNSTKNNITKSALNNNPLSTGEVVEGRQYPYVLRIPGAGWSLGTEHRLAKGSDIEINGPDKQTWAITHVYRNQSMDETIQGRYTIFNETYKHLYVKEHRELLNNNIIPVSYATYQWKNPPDSEHFLRLWVTTIEVDGQSIELIVQASNNLLNQTQAELLAKSLRLQ